MAEAETFVCRSAKQIIPPTRIKIALTAVSIIVVLESLKLPTKPRLKISNNAPKITPLVPASDSNRLVVRE